MIFDAKTSAFAVAQSARHLSEGRKFATEVNHDYVLSPEK
jgi:hypothetical protein